MEGGISLGMLWIADQNPIEDELSSTKITFIFWHILLEDNFKENSL
jgi:hypothetical protein